METKERYFINHSGELLDETMPLRDTDITDRLNEQDDDLTRYRARIAALEAENTTLRAALEPFVVWGAEVTKSDDRPDDRIVFRFDEITVTLGHIRAAITALAGEKGA